MSIIILLACIGLLIWENKREKPRNYLSVLYIIIGLSSVMGQVDENYDPDFRVGNDYLIDQNYLCASTKESILNARKTQVNYELSQLTWSAVKAGTRVELTEINSAADIYGFQCLEGKYYGKFFYADKDIFKHKKIKE